MSMWKLVGKIMLLSGALVSAATVDFHSNTPASNIKTLATGGRIYKVSSVLKQPVSPTTPSHALSEVGLAPAIGTVSTNLSGHKVNLTPAVELNIDTIPTPRELGGGSHVLSGPGVSPAIGAIGVPSLDEIHTNLSGPNLSGPGVAPAIGVTGAEGIHTTINGPAMAPAIGMTGADGINTKLNGPGITPAIGVAGVDGIHTTINGPGMAPAIGMTGTDGINTKLNGPGMAPAIGMTGIEGVSTKLNGPGMAPAIGVAGTDGIHTTISGPGVGPGLGGWSSELSTNHWTSELTTGPANEFKSTRTDLSRGEVSEEEIAFLSEQFGMDYTLTDEYAKRMGVDKELNNKPLALKSPTLPPLPSLKFQPPPQIEPMGLGMRNIRRDTFLASHPKKTFQISDSLNTIGQVQELPNLGSISVNNLPTPSGSVNPILPSSTPTFPPSQPNVPLPTSNPSPPSLPTQPPIHTNTLTNGVAPAIGISTNVPNSGGLLSNTPISPPTFTTNNNHIGVAPAIGNNVISNTNGGNGGLGVAPAITGTPSPTTPPPTRCIDGFQECSRIIEGVSGIGQCYNPEWQTCIHGVICGLDEKLCDGRCFHSNLFDCVDDVLFLK